MPWKECHVMDERLRFVARLLEGEKMAPLCAEFGISRKTGYKIFDRYKDCGLGVRRGQDGLADVERRGHAHRFDRHVHPLASGQLQHALDRLAVGAIDQGRGPEVFGHAKAIVVEIDHQYGSWRIELRRQ